MGSSVASTDEAARLSPHSRRGGWITFPFIIGAFGCLILAAGGWVGNLTVYLIQEFNINSTSAAKIYNFVSGSISFFPIVAAVIADSFAGCFSVIWFSYLISLLGVVVLVLTAAIDQLRPQRCDIGSNPCKYPSLFQFAVLYLGLALAALGNAGTRVTFATVGADQLDSPKHQSVFFNWFTFTMYTAAIVSSTAIVYVQDNYSWTWGFTICAVVNLIGLTILFSGRRFYRVTKPEGSPFKSLVRVVFAAISKRKLTLSQKGEDYYRGSDQDHTKAAAEDLPTNFFRFLNRAALYTEGDTTQEGIITHPWKLCTVQQVESLKSLIKLFPLWSTSLLLNTPLTSQLSFTVIQALTMDRHLGPRFEIPAGSFPVFLLVSTSLSVVIIDRLGLPLWEKLTKRPLTLLQRIGIGHAVTIASMAVSAAVEAKRISIARSNNLQNTNATIPMSGLWLVPQLAMAGLSEAISGPGQIAFYYQEFPVSLKSTATAVVVMLVGIAFYTSNAIVGLVGRFTDWLPGNINNGRLDHLYWLFCIIGGLNFGYYLICASLYKSRSYEKPAVADD